MKTRMIDFGFESIPLSEKTARVTGVFNAVAEQYDLMNDLMSLGLHRLWKQYLLLVANSKSGDKILDLAGGTGDISRGFLKKHPCTVYLADINIHMLQTGRDKCIDQGSLHPVYIQADAEQLPFQDNYFDIISIAFGLRNITDKATALASMYRVLKPGGCLLILEFSHPKQESLLKFLYDRYSFSCIPLLGKYIAGAEDSYRYLVESIRQHPDQEALKKIILAADFDSCTYTNLTAGIVCLHKAYKY